MPTLAILTHYMIKRSAAIVTPCLRVDKSSLRHELMRERLVCTIYHIPLDKSKYSQMKFGWFYEVKIGKFIRASLLGVSQSDPSPMSQARGGSNVSYNEREG